MQQRTEGLGYFLKARQEILNLGKSCQGEGGAVLGPLEFLMLVLDNSFIIKGNETCPDGLYQSTLFYGGFLYHCITEKQYEF